jgi:hypothetical protein
MEMKPIERGVMRQSHDSVQATCEATNSGSVWPPCCGGRLKLTFKKTKSAEDFWSTPGLKRP